MERARELTSAECRIATSARSAVEGAEIVILATSSATPVIEANWLESGAHVTTLGPKQVGRSEFGLDLPAIATIIATDSIEQIDAYDPPSVLFESPRRDRLVYSASSRRGCSAPRTWTDYSLLLGGTRWH